MQMAATFVRRLCLWFCAIGMSAGPVPAQEARPVIEPVTTPMTFRLASSGGNCVGCEWVVAEGVITNETPDLLRAFIRDWEHIYFIVFNSPGGNLFAGFELGKILREQNANVSIAASRPMVDLPNYDEQHPGICVSACAYAVLGGGLRSISEGELGFHQFSDPKALESPEMAQFTATDRVKDQLITGRIVQYLREMGIDLRLYELAAEVAPDQLRFLTDAELIDFGINTNPDVVQRDWTMLPFEKGLVAESETLRNFLSPNGGKVRFYCSKGKTYLAFFRPSRLFRGESIVTEIKKAFDSTPPDLMVGDRPLGARYEGVYPSKDGATFVTLFSLSNTAASNFAKAEVVTASYGAGRATEAFYSLLRLGPLPTDRRAMTLAAKNCIN